MSKKGMSDVVTTLIIILLVIAAIGIIWVVVRPFISGGTEQFDIKSGCLNVNLQIVKAICNSSTNLTNCTVTVKRADSGKEFNISGVYLIFTDANLATKRIEVPVNIPQLASVLVLPNNESGVSNTKNITKIEVVAYFNDKSGKPTYCDAASSYIPEIVR